MSRGGGRCSRRARCIRRRHGVGAKIGVDGDDINHIVKPAGVGMQFGGEGTICGRERQGRLRIDAEGNLYVLDSEDEESDMEVAADGVLVAVEGAPNRNQDGCYDVQDHLMVDADADGAAVKHLPPKGPPLVVGEGAPADDLPTKGPLLVPTYKAEDMDMAPEVAARLKEVLANTDPIYHDVCISMYKVLVPALFRP